MLKAGKLQSIANSAIMANLFENFFKLRVQKYGGFLLNCTKIPLIVLCWNSQQSRLSRICIKIQEKENKSPYIAASWLANEKKWEQLKSTLHNSNLKRDKAIIRMKHKFVQGNESSSYRT